MNVFSFINSIRLFFILIILVTLILITFLVYFWSPGGLGGPRDLGDRFKIEKQNWKFRKTNKNQENKTNIIYPTKTTKKNQHLAIDVHSKIKKNVDTRMSAA